MKARVLSLCLYAYPRAVRARDGRDLGELAIELAGDHGVVREAFGLLRGGVAERRRQQRTGRSLVAVCATAVLALAGLTTTAVAQAGTADEDLYVCAKHCADAEAEVESRVGDGWSCAERRTQAGASWRCVRD